MILADAGTTRSSSDGSRRRLGNYADIAVALVALLGITVAMLPFRAQLDKAHVALLYLLVVLCCSIAGRKPGLTAGLLAFLFFNLLFVPPYYTLAVANPLDWLVLASFLVTSIVATELVNLQRKQGRLAELRRFELDQLATLGAKP